MNANLDPNDPRRYIFRYDEHMPDTDDLSLIVLKGHLLVEEMLVELSGLLFPTPAFLEKANLRFQQLANVVRAAEPMKPDDMCWNLIFALNTLRNELVHNLEPPKLEKRIQEILVIDSVVQPFEDDGILYDKSRESELETAERLRQAIVSCTQFLHSIIFKHERQKKRLKSLQKRPRRTGHGKG
jgi:hypothetical protein